MPVNREDQHEERIARIEQILEDLRREVRRFSESHQEAVEEARATRERSQNARGELRKAVADSRRRAAARTPKSKS